MDMTFLDFDKLNKSEKMNETINESMLMGSLGEIESNRRFEYYEVYR